MISPIDAGSAKMKFIFYLHRYDASTGVTRNVSSGFKSLAIPSNEAIISDDKPSNKFLLAIIELFIKATRIWKCSWIAWFNFGVFFYHFFLCKFTCGASRRSGLIVSFGTVLMLLFTVSLSLRSNSSLFSSISIFKKKQQQTK